MKINPELRKFFTAEELAFFEHTSFGTFDTDDEEAENFDITEEDDEETGGKRKYSGLRKRIKPLKRNYRSKLHA